jgi:cytochrome c biogenesis protein CcdA
MPGLILLVLSIGVVDSLNPATVAPGLYLALGEHAKRRLAWFTAGVFGVYLLAGIALTLGPARAFPQPGRHTRYLIETGLGVALLVFAAVLWLGRERVARHLARAEDRVGRSPLLLGAGITIVELPTAFPYFAAIAAIAASRRNAFTEIGLLIVFNVCFVAPLVGILVLRSVMGARGVLLLEALRTWLHRRAPVLLPALILVIAIALLVVGGIRLATG